MTSPALAVAPFDTWPVRRPARSLSFYRCGGGPIAAHDLQSRASVAQGLADFLGYAHASPSGPEHPPAPGDFLVPSDTICSLDEARRIGLRGVEDLYGGVVPHPFVATKVVSHGLVGEGAGAPHGWVEALAGRLGNAVLPGYSVFSKDDAWVAGVRMLANGPVRLKPADGVGGAGQTVATSSRALAAQLDALESAAFARGLALERHLARVETCSVGRIRVGPQIASYVGKQRSTRNHRGETVYGGSSLTVIAGDFDALMRLDPSASLRLAIEQARRYHEVMHEAFPAMFASRCNYDVAQGVDASGRQLSGVLEQSWRVGGCSGAELLALRALKVDPGRVVRASTHEIYGDAVVPRKALVLFDGIDPEAGRLVKYATARPHVHA